MNWNWQQPDWPRFSYETNLLKELEERFLHSSGFLLGAYQHISDMDKNILMVDIVSDEAIKTSEIEGEYLNRDSVQSSILRQFGLNKDNRKIPPAEQGIAQMMVDLYQHFFTPLSHELLFNWHKMLTNGRRDLTMIGQYRTHAEPMQIISGYVHDPKIHFEAPPSGQVADEMEKFIEWFNNSAPRGKSPMAALSRAALTHWYFVCIHPFEDGNGRIARALAEKALSQCLGQPTLIALSYTISRHKKDYYTMLGSSNQSNEITSYMIYFAKTILDAQAYTQKMIDFIIEKTKLYERVRDQLNPRQEKVIARMFREGIEGFKGGLSADKYIKITGSSRATATRDMQDLVEKSVLIRIGEHKSTRYFLDISWG